MARQTEGSPKPLISILMAVYEPRVDWLREQLASLDAQTYPNLRLYIRDDCSPTFSLEALNECARSIIHSFPFELRRNEENLGSNGTFERLTEEAEGVYFAYCDQDDVWLPEKLETLQEVIEREKALLVCSDMLIIDENGNQTADSITKVRRHHVFKSGEGIAPQMLVSNFVTGCAMLIRADTAKEAVPFCPYMVHDHYLALYSATKGRIVSIPSTLIKYRIHSGNQTLMMAGVSDKKSYYQQRIAMLLCRMNWLEQVFREDEALHREILNAIQWVEARDANFKGKKDAKRVLLKNWRFSPWTSLFEAIAVMWPERLFMFIIEIKRRNII